MRKQASKMATTASIVAQGPAGVRRLGAGCLIVVLLGAVAVAGLVAFGAWTAKNRAETSRRPLPCPPSTVAVTWSTKDAPAPAREAVTEALRKWGRKPVEAGWGDEQRDLVVIWSPGMGTAVSGSSSPVKLTLGSTPTAAEVKAALGARLAACGPTPAPSTSTKTASDEPQGPAQGDREYFSWPWERGWSATGGLSLTIGLWWLAGPNLARGLWRVAWPVRLTRRKWQRWAWRRALRRGALPVEWPLKPSRGQRWHEDDAAMHDHRTHRQQIADGEPQRRAALWEAIREERLMGLGIGPAGLWRLVYRQPAPEGAPEKEAVSQ